MVTRPADNAIMWRWDQDPFGTAVPNQNPQALGTFVYNLRFPGQYYDPETGLNYNYSRDYDPTVGRYVESDPIGLQGGSYSTYAYANLDPISNVDPPGLSGNGTGWGQYRFNPYVIQPYQRVPGIPPGSVSYTAPNGECFPAPERTNWALMYMAGEANGITGAWMLAQGGPLDLQRSGGNVYPAYANAANYGVGVYMNGAGVPLWLSNAIGNAYGALNSNNSSQNNWQQWWANGWNAANSGQLPSGPSNCSCGNH
jgi:RHS repeat-associated protein